MLVRRCHLWPNLAGQVSESRGRSARVCSESIRENFRRCSEMIRDFMLLRSELVCSHLPEALAEHSSKIALRCSPDLVVVAPGAAFGSREPICPRPAGSAQSASPQSEPLEAAIVQLLHPRASISGRSSERPGFGSNPRVTPLGFSTFSGKRERESALRSGAPPRHSQGGPQLGRRRRQGGIHARGPRYHQWV